jgi:hypothetical protein
VSGLGGISIGCYVCVVDGRVGGAKVGAHDVLGEEGSDVHVVDCRVVCGLTVGGVKGEGRVVPGDGAQCALCCGECEGAVPDEIVLSSTLLKWFCVGGAVAGGLRSARWWLWTACRYCS